MESPDAAKTAEGSPGRNGGTTSKRRWPTRTSVIHYTTSLDPGHAEFRHPL